jgi:hypothetical protein
MIEPPYPAHFSLHMVKTPIKFYEGINPRTGNACYGGCICSIKGALGTAEKKYPGTLANAQPGAIVMGRYKGDVIHPGETVALIGDCAGVDGRLEAGKMIRIKGCPPQVAHLAIFFLHKFKIKSPAFEIANVAKIARHTVAELFTKMLIPFSSKIGPTMGGAGAVDHGGNALCEAEYDRHEESVAAPPPRRGRG